jgi:hypothetical protein
VRVVRLTLPLEEIERKLSGAVSVGRVRDVCNAVRWLAHGIGADLGDLSVANDRPVADVADEILRWLAWPPVA